MEARRERTRTRCRRTPRRRRRGRHRLPHRVPRRPQGGPRRRLRRGRAGAAERPARAGEGGRPQGRRDHPALPDDAAPPPPSRQREGEARGREAARRGGAVAEEPGRDRGPGVRRADRRADRRDELRPAAAGQGNVLQLPDQPLGGRRARLPAARRPQRAADPPRPQAADGVALSRRTSAAGRSGSRPTGRRRGRSPRPSA